VPLLAMVGGPAGAGATPAATNKDCGQLDPDSVSSTAEVVKWIQCSWQLSWLGVEQ
jgi:hypothetical protein